MRSTRNFVRVLVWFVAAAPLWLTGAAVGGGARPAWWAAATLVELVGTWTAHALPGRRLKSRHVGFAGFIATQTWHRANLFDHLAWPRLVALSALVIGGTFTPAAPAYLSAVIAATTVVALAALEELRPTGDLQAKPTPHTAHTTDQIT